MQDIDDSDVGGRRVSADLRSELKARGLITGWDNEKRAVKAGYSPSEVQKYCVQHSAWQVCRLSMKGVDTYRKLEICEAWWDKHHGEAQTEMGCDVAEMQVGNYLGALVRGGQLNNERQIRKAR